MYEVSPQHCLVWLWTGVRRPANKSFLVCICVNKKCKVTRNRFLQSPSSCSFSFSSLALTTCFLFHPLPTILFLSISSRLPSSSFLLFPTPPPPLSLSSSILLDMAPRSLPLSLTAIHSINQVFYGWFWSVVFFAVKDLCWVIFQISFWNLEACCQRKQRGKTKRKRRGSLSESNASFKGKRNRKLHHMKLWLTNLHSWSQL